MPDSEDQLAQHHYGSADDRVEYDQHAQRPYGIPPVYPPTPGTPPTKITHEEPSFPKWSDDLSELRDPVDMIKVEPGDEADVAIERADDLMADAAVALRTADNLGSETSSWKITREYCRADSHSQLATAQAAYASAVELRKIAEILAANHAWIENSD